MLWSFRKKRQQEDLLLALRNEVDRNLERYYVIEQRQFITMDFEMGAWQKVRDVPGIRLPEEVLDYAATLEDFNRAFADCQAFEAVYSKIENKNLENAQILHAKKEALDEKFLFIRPRILAAREALRSRV